MGAKKTNEQFLAELKEKNVNVFPLEAYTKSSEPILCRCNRCGKEWKIRPNNLLRGYGCPVCGIEKRSKSRTKEAAAFVYELKSISPEINVLEDYSGAKKSIRVSCSKCKHEWKALPTNLLKGKGCPKCAIGKRTSLLSVSNEEYIEKVKKINPSIKVEGKYEGIKVKMQYSCQKCGYKWCTYPSSVLSGHGCPRCAKNGRYTQEEFLQRMKAVNPKIEILGQYTRSADKLLCKCLICGNEWYAKPNGLLQGGGCPSCYHTTTSFVEEAIFFSLAIVLGEENIKVRDRATIGKELDIYVPSLYVAIEPGSWKWHKDSLDKDEQKRVLCCDKGIRLLTIYTDYPYNEPPFQNDCIVFKENIGVEKNHNLLKPLFDYILNYCGLNYTYDNEEMNDIIHYAYFHSRRMSTEEFKRKIAERHPLVEVLEEYTGTWNRIKVRCSMCKKEWQPIANNLLRGHGCPNCSRKNKKKNAII